MFDVCEGLETDRNLIGPISSKTLATVSFNKVFQACTCTDETFVRPTMMQSDNDHENCAYICCVCRMMININRVCGM